MRNLLRIAVTLACLCAPLFAAEPATLEGDKPWPFYAPATANSFVVGRGADVGLPFNGQAPTLGVFELGDKPPRIGGGGAK